MSSCPRALSLNLKQHASLWNPSMPTHSTTKTTASLSLKARAEKQMPANTVNTENKNTEARYKTDDNQGIKHNARDEASVKQGARIVDSILAIAHAVTKLSDHPSKPRSVSNRIPTSSQMKVRHTLRCQAGLHLRLHRKPIPANLRLRVVHALLLLHRHGGGANSRPILRC